MCVYVIDVSDHVCACPGCVNKFCTRVLVWILQMRGKFLRYYRDTLQKFKLLKQEPRYDMYTLTNTLCMCKNHGVHKPMSVSVYGLHTYSWLNVHTNKVSCMCMLLWWLIAICVSCVPNRTSMYGPSLSLALMAISPDFFGSVWSCQGRQRHNLESK